MDFTEADAFEALGVEPEAPQDGAETGQDGPAQAGEASQPNLGQAGLETPENGPGEAPPPTDGQTDGDGQTGSGGQKPTDAVPEGQGAEPARRLDVEQAVARALQAERERQSEQMRSFFQRAGLKNTITGEDISSMEDFTAWERAYQAQRLERELAEGRLSPEGLERAIANSPAVKRAEELARQAERQEQEQRRAEFEGKVRDEMAEIQRMDPSVHSLEDIMKGPGGQAFYGYVQRGLSYLDAFRLSHFDQLRRQVNETAQKAAQQAAQAARQQARELEHSKDHLTGAGVVQGQGAAAVPPAEMALFRDLLPGASEAEIQNYYNNYERSLGK